MRIRRCAVLYLEPREEVEVDAAERELLGALSPGEWRDSRTVPDESRAPLRRLPQKGSGSFSTGGVPTRAWGVVR
jgi:hypothetical protein